MESPGTRRLHQEMDYWHITEEAFAKLTNSPQLEAKKWEVNAMLAVEFLFFTWLFGIIFALLLIVACRLAPLILLAPIAFNLSAILKCERVWLSLGKKKPSSK